MKNLKELYLGGNQLKTIPEEIKDINESLQLLSLAQTESSSGNFISNPIPENEVEKIQSMLPNTKIIYVFSK